MKSAVLTLFCLLVGGFSALGADKATPAKTRLEKYQAYLILPQTPFYQQFSEDYRGTWEATVDAFLIELKRKSKTAVPADVVDAFKDLRQTPPELELLNSAQNVAHYNVSYLDGEKEIQRAGGAITISTGILDLVDYQRDRVLALLSHEMTHALQDKEQLYGRSKKIRTALGKVSVPFIKMTAENMADEISVAALAQMGANPRGALELQEMVSVLDAPEGRKLDDLDWLLKAGDEHRTTSARMRKIETKLATIGAKPEAPNPGTRYRYDLERLTEAPEAREGWDQLEKWVEALPQGELFLPKNLSEFKVKLLDIPVLEDLPEDGTNHQLERFTHGQYHRVFSVFTKALDRHAESLSDLEELVRVFETGVEDLGSEFPIQGYLNRVKDEYSNIFGMTEKRPSLLEDLTLLTKDPKTLSFEEALVQLNLKTFQKFREFKEVKKLSEESKWTPNQLFQHFLINPQDPENPRWNSDRFKKELAKIDRDDSPRSKRQFFEYTPQFLFREDEHYIEVTMLSGTARRYMSEGNLDAAFSQLSQNHEHLSDDAFLARLKTLISSAIDSRITIGSQSQPTGLFQSQAVFNRAFERRFPKASLASFKKLVERVQSLSVPEEERRKLLGELTVAKFQAFASPITMRLTEVASTSTFHLHMNLYDLLNEINMANSSQHQTGDKIDAYMGDFGPGPEELSAERLEALSQAPSDTAFIGVQNKIVREAHPLVHSLLNGPIKRGAGFDSFMAFNLRDDVDTIKDRLHPFANAKLLENGVSLERWLPVGPPLVSPEALVVREEDYRFINHKNAISADSAQNDFLNRTLLLRGGQLANERQMYWARRQFEIMEAFTRGAVTMPHGTAVLTTSIPKSETPYLLSADGHIGGPMGAPDLIYPMSWNYSAKEKRELSSLMMDHMLDYYAGVPSVSRGDTRELKLNKKFAPELARAVSLPVLEEEAGTADLDELLQKLPHEFPRWFKFEQLLDASSAWGLFADRPEFMETLLFRRPVERIHSILLERLKKERGFDQLPPLERLDLLVKLTPEQNGSFILDPEIQKALGDASPEELKQFLKWEDHQPPAPAPEPKRPADGKEKPKKRKLKEQATFGAGADLVRYGTLHPMARVEGVARAMRGISGNSAKAQFAAAMLPNAEAYRESWSIYLGDTKSDTKPLPLDKALMEAIERHVPKGKAARTASEEFYERMFHQLDLLMTQFDSQTAIQLAKYISHPDRYPLSEATKKQVRNLLAPLFGAHEHTELERELLRVYQRLEPEKQRAMVFGMLESHPSAIHSPEFQLELANSPIFSKESSEDLNSIKEVTWKNMSHREKAFFGATVLQSSRPEGKLADDDDLIVEHLESIGVVGRKTAQLFKVHGSFIRPSLREAFGKFRSENVHSRRLRLIKEMQTFFRQDFGIEFWDVVASVGDVLGAGSMKTAVHATLKDGREVVFKIVDPYVRDMVMRQVQLVEQSVNDWQDSTSKTKGVVLYLLRRLRHAVETEFDLEHERVNTDTHAKFIQGRKAKTSSPVCSIGELCSRNINTVEFIKNRGNAHRESATPLESDAISQEILAQILSDRFVHGDLQNRANILLLEGKLPPAFIDLSLSEKVDDAEVNVLLRLFHSLGEVAQSATRLSALAPSVQAILKSPSDKSLLEKAKAELRAFPEYKDLTDAQWEGFLKDVGNGDFVGALKQIAPAKVKGKIEDVLLILDHAVEPLPGEKAIPANQLLNSTLSTVLKKAMSEGKVDVLDIVLGLERNGAVFSDRYMFLLEAFALSVADLAQAYPKDSYGQLLERFADRIQKQMPLARKVSYAATSTEKLIQNCQKALQSLKNP